MKMLLRIPLLFLSLGSLGIAGEPLQFVHGSAGNAQEEQTTEPKPLTRLEVRRGGKGPALVTHQITETHGRPYIHPLRSPDGKGILTEYSPGHHKHQTGLYWGPTRINGRDYFHHYDGTYWTKSRLTKSDPRLTGGPLRWTCTSHLANEQAEVILEDSQAWTMTDHEDYYTLDLVWSGKALVDVTISHYPYGGLFLRMPWKPGLPASCINSAGDKDQAGEGKPASWVDLAMKVEGMDELAHIAILDHPDNPGHPTLWRIDDQFGIGPALARRGDINIPKGQSATYRYRLVVYQGDHDRALLEKAEESFRKAP